MLHFPSTSLLFPTACPSSPWGTHISGRLGKENNLELGLALRMPALEVARIRGSQSLLAAASFCSSSQALAGLAGQWRGQGAAKGSTQRAGLPREGRLRSLLALRAVADQLADSC